MSLPTARPDGCCSLAVCLGQQSRTASQPQSTGWSATLATMGGLTFTPIELEHAVLHLLADHDGPLGSSTLAPRLQALGHTGSEPTIGRLLRGLDAHGLTVRVANRGRLLTEAGQGRLAALCKIDIQRSHEHELLRSVRTSTIDDVMEVLVARRALEREAARLAAEQATPDEIAAMAATIELERRAVAGGWSAIEADVDFHLQVAQAGHNRVLAAAIDLIRRNLRVNAALKVLLRQAGHTWIIGHEEIFAAIARRAPAAAERAMLEHIDCLIADINRVYIPGEPAEPGGHERRPDQITH